MKEFLKQQLENVLDLKTIKGATQEIVIIAFTMCWPFVQMRITNI